MTDLSDLVDSATNHGWIVTLFIGTWGVLLRFALGRHYKASDEVKQRLMSIEHRLAVIESRSFRRRKSDVV